MYAHNCTATLVTQWTRLVLAYHSTCTHLQNGFDTTLATSGECDHTTKQGNRSYFAFEGKVALHSAILEHNGTH